MLLVPLSPRIIIIQLQNIRRFTRGRFISPLSRRNSNYYHISHEDENCNVCTEFARENDILTLSKVNILAERGSRAISYSLD